MFDLNKTKFLLETGDKSVERERQHSSEEFIQQYVI